MFLSISRKICESERADFYFYVANHAPTHVCLKICRIFLIIVNKFKSNICENMCSSKSLYLKKNWIFAGIQETLRILDSSIYSLQKSFQLLYFLLLYLFHLFCFCFGMPIICGWISFLKFLPLFLSVFSLPLLFLNLPSI